jgi:hypothetical protein
MLRRELINTYVYYYYMCMLMLHALLYVVARGSWINILDKYQVI